ncbi:mitochondrial ornithine carrier protein-like protein [Leishmania mexicana MHOM/GT/2001/U1103]|uniref:Mitochondrial ornithine carrier protein-like protein n=1 Tax=Leishmania mexicana (strain MHOM/GT/2001/U1103) TaxID=929439 RepID=E9AQH7_LEIMU|nr:mitochondrial ornithine carrier protein-like protein [Leishmania mexicana MHOM/GT/2001/U1103]CBZ25196.1 mitochondrial ornithine carrier protein-like protein [Leishmania mexicana MHOM/GT/2001/U1103]
MSLWNDFVAGTAGGFAGVLIEHPFDTIKVLLQTYGGTRYAGYTDCITRLFRQDGVIGFYRGVTARFVASGFEHAWVLATYKWTLRLIGAGDRPTLPEILLGGCGSGVAATVCLTPFELVKCRMQVDDTKGQRRYRGSLDCAQQVFREHGCKGLYRGGVAMLCREVPGSVAWCGTYDILKSWMTPEGMPTQSLPLWKLMIAGGWSGVAFWTAFYPSDMVKTRIQVDPAYEKLSLWGAMTRVYQTEGLRALYRGWALTAVRSFPSNAVIFGVFDCCNRALSPEPPLAADVPSTWSGHGAAS